MRVLGIDAGATKTECLLANEKGQILSKARGPGGNFQLYDEEEVEFVLDDLITRALAGYRGPVDALCVGMAGAGRERDYRAMQRILRRLRRARRNLVTNDALIALVAGTGERYGVVLIVGTGATAYGINRKGETARAGGWGHLLGDEGGGYWMGLRALQAIVRAHDGRAKATSLKQSVLARLGIDDTESLVHRVYREFAREEIAALAPLVQTAADLGDAAAQAIIDDATREFMRSVESVIGKLELAGQSFRLVLSGGLWKAVPVLRQDFEKFAKKIAPWVNVHLLDAEPARGAVHLAVELASSESEEAATLLNR
jgi:N-acetylglucosamine kinase-like BadF-type ATPase